MAALLNDAARGWLDDNAFSEPWQWLDGALLTDHPHPRDLVDGIEAAGFSIAP